MALVSSEEFLAKYEKSISNALYQTEYQNREDLAQEIRLKLLQKRGRITFKEKPPSFVESLIT